MIRSLRIKRFLGAENVTYTFSPGVTLITGPNGSGKTTILEGLQWSIWGKNARSADIGTETTIKTEKTTLTRTVNKSGEAVTYNSTKTSKTKILGEVTEEFGDYSAWSNTMLINGKTVGRFFKIGNSDRWALIAKIVGAEEFYKSKQVALEQARLCRDKVVALEEKKRNSEYNCRHIQTSITRACGYSMEYEELEAFDPEALLEEEITAKAGLNQEAASFPSFEDAIQRLQIAQGNLQIELLDIQEELCKECKQPLQDKRVAILEKMSSIKDELAEVRAAYAESKSRYNKHRDNIRAISAKREERNRAEGRKERCEQNWENWDGEIITGIAEYIRELTARDTISDELEAKRKEKEVFSMSAEALEKAGDMLIGKVIVSLTSIANTFLETIESKIRVEISCSGRAIYIKTNLPGESYENCSSGEQRRIDLCMTFALASIVSEIGRIPEESPYVIDEAFDSLDEQGIAAVLLLACKLAETRQVFLVSHTIPAVAASIGVVPIQLG